ncbi:hypothetical protein A9R05_33020 (plasmid) [Burkholderia sp. KK1]|nr:hypothetical protein A9R05_33020 [Burkholderia sp. KK1]
MTQIAGFPYFEFEVDKEGKPVDPNAHQTTPESISAAGVTDLFVVSHGWNNDKADARKLYETFFGKVREVLDNAAPPGAARKYAVLGIFWPSKKFADDDLIPGGGAALDGSISTAYLKDKLKTLKGVFDHPQADDRLVEAAKLVDRLEDDPAVQEEFVKLIRSLPVAPKQKSSETLNAEDASGQFFDLDAGVLMQRLSLPAMQAPPTEAEGGAADLGDAGGAAGLGNFFNGIKSGALNLLNFTTYYQMKERAGLVGRTALFDMLSAIAARDASLKIHLIGHSFGARLVTSAVLGSGAKALPLKPASMMLLQAAFSHNGFASKFDKVNDGFFRTVVSESKISGPIAITFTVNDKAVGLAYPLASLIAGQDASGIGDANDPFGGLGRNGAQHTPEANTVVLGAVGSPNEFMPGHLHNLNCDAVISGHSDISKLETAYALLSLIAKT